MRLMLERNNLASVSTMPRQQGPDGKNRFLCALLEPVERWPQAHFARDDVEFVCVSETTLSRGVNNNK
jgi:hypothetical protein